MATWCRWLSVIKPTLLDDALGLIHSQFEEMDMDALEMGKLKNLLQYFKKVWFDGIFRITDWNSHGGQRDTNNALERQNRYLLI